MKDTKRLEKIDDSIGKANLRLVQIQKSIFHTIQKLETERWKIYDDNFKRTFDKIVEGDYCNAEVGDEVIINKDCIYSGINYRGKVGKVVKKFDSYMRMDYDKKTCTNYVVAFKRMSQVIIGHPSSEPRRLEADFSHADIEIFKQEQINKSIEAEIIKENAVKSRI